MTLAERLWRRTAVGGPDECWPWLGFRMPNGYGQINAGGRGEGVLLTHRAAWIVTFGPIPEGRHVCHRCDNRICVNPRHLFVGTRIDNMQDASRKGRLDQKTTRSQREEMVRAYLAGEGSSRQIARPYGVHPSLPYVLSRLAHYQTTTS